MKEIKVIRLCDNCKTDISSKNKNAKVCSGKCGRILYYSKNENKEKRNINSRNRYKNDILYRLRHNYRVRLRDIFRFNYENIKPSNLLGCSYNEFKIYIEEKFEPWMTWENKGLYNGELNYGWDIDHIIPLSNAVDIEHLKLLNHYTNLQPMCSRFNRDIKRDKYF